MEVHTSIVSYICYPFDDTKRFGFQAALSESIKKSPEYVSNPSIKNIVRFVLTKIPADFDKKEFRRAKALQKIVSYLCRMIVHHHNQLPRGASLGKSMFLTSEWAERGDVKGYSKSALKTIWNDHKGTAPLVASYMINCRRASRNAQNNLPDKQITESVHLASNIISRSSNILQNALSIHDLLSNHYAWGETSPTLPYPDQIFMPLQLNISPRTINWKSLKEHELNLFLDGDYKLAVDEAKNPHNSNTIITSL